MKDGIGVCVCVCSTDGDIQAIQHTHKNFQLQFVSFCDARKLWQQKRHYENGAQASARELSQS